MDTTAAVKSDRNLYHDSTYEIVSIAAYLIGVPERIFLNDHEPPKIEVYRRLDLNKNARIIRHLCLLRTAIEHNYKFINELMKFEFKSIINMPEYVPYESIRQLAEDGVSVARKSCQKPSDYIVEINRVISDRINNCKSLFPMWLNWEYMRDIFIMPDGLTNEGTKAAADIYYENKPFYPYQVYMNWPPSDEGNIFYNDKKFITLLYAWHNDYFADISKVTDAGVYVKGGIYDFIDDSGTLVIIVDCENSDPYKLCSVLKNLDWSYTSKVQSIILFDDVHTASAWSILKRFTDIPVDHITVERIKSTKSLVDVMLTARACQEHYEKGVDSFIIVSSDSDYWGLISSLPRARFLVMAEREKCGADMKNAMMNSGIFYCYIDDFYSGNTDDMKTGALFRELHRYLDSAVHLNANDMLDAALEATRINMTAVERKQFYDRHIKQMKLEIDENGDVSIELKR